MTLRRKAAALVQRKNAEQAAASTGGEASTPYEKLLRAAERGQFEALVRKARPAEPLAMVTPQEREAGLRASGQWPPEKAGSKHEPKPAPPPAPAAGEPIPGPTPELTPNEQYLAEHCRWHPRGPHAAAHRHPPRSCVTDYDPLGEGKGEE